MVNNSKEVRKQILDVVACIAAVVTILTYLVFAVNSVFPFMVENAFYYNILVIIRDWAPLIVVGLVGIEAISKRNIIIRILLYLIIALVVINKVFPGTWEQLVTFVKSKV